MPEPLSETQTRQVREEVARQLRPVVRRMWIWGGTMVAAIAIAAGVGVYEYGRTHRDIRLVSCQRAQAFAIGLRLVVHTGIPPHMKGRTPAEQRQVDEFYRKIRPALRVPSCS